MNPLIDELQFARWCAERAYELGRQFIEQTDWPMSRVDEWLRLQFIKRRLLS